MRTALTAASMLLVALSAVASEEKVPVYTNDDLERMFGPPPRPVSDPPKQATPEDWAWVEQYLDRAYARLDADRQYDLQRRTLDIAEERTYVDRDRYGYGYGYGGYAAFGLRYPASVWYGNVSRSYATRGAGSCNRVTPGTPAGRGTRSPTGSSSRPSPRSGGRAHAKAP